MKASNIIPLFIFLLTVVGLIIYYKLPIQNAIIDRHQFSCTVDSDCTIVNATKIENQEFEYMCCGMESCNPNFAQPQWKAVNVRWAKERKEVFCPAGKHSCPLIRQCVQDPSTSYDAQCVDKMCQKIAL